MNTYQALILPGAVDAFAIFWMRQVIAEIPDELLDAARIDGCGELGLFTRIVMPLIRPALAGLGVLTVMNIYNDFVWPVVAANSEKMATLQVVLSTSRRTSPATGSAPTTPPSPESSWPPPRSRCCPWSPCSWRSRSTSSTASWPAASS